MLLYTKTSDKLSNCFISYASIVEQEKETLKWFLPGLALRSRRIKKSPFINENCLNNLSKQKLFNFPEEKLCTSSKHIIKVLNRISKLHFIFIIRLNQNGDNASQESLPRLYLRTRRLLIQELWYSPLSLLFFYTISTQAKPTFQTGFFTVQNNQLSNIAGLDCDHAGLIVITRYLYSTSSSWIINCDTRTEWSPIRSVTIRINKIGQPRSRSPIFQSWEWLQTKLDDTKSCYHNRYNFRKKKHRGQTSPVETMSEVQNSSTLKIPYFVFRISGCCNGHCDQFWDWWI